MVPYRWEHEVCDEAAAGELARAAGIEPAIARLLMLRGITDAAAAARFLRPSLDHLHDPMLLAGMETAVERLLRAVANHERIAVHGDYDVDGITATVILRRALELLGGEVVHFVPDRMKDGYGLNTPAIERLHAEGAGVIVSVDCGIRGGDAARRARDLGVDLIITDHHEPDEELPPALAVVNPKRRDCSYPDKNLAGVGVALKLVQALTARAGRGGWLPAFVKMAAIGTLADVVPLVGENRVIARLGLEALSTGPHKAGLRALIESAGLAGKPIDSYHVSFMLAPRVNAAGRMSSPDIALRLLLAADDGMMAEARELAGQLNAENERRQLEERAILAEARKAVESDPDIGARAALVVAGEGWHRGVIGIVASRLVDAFHRPAVVIAIEGETAHGSCRSIPGFDMLAALTACAEHLQQFGGHRAAAGLTLGRSHIRAFRDALTRWADDRLGPDDLRPRLRIDGQLGFRQITPSLYDGISLLAPFGAGNPKPTFWTPGASLADGPRRIKERHLSMSLRQDGVALRGVFWRAAERASEMAAARDGLDVAYSIERNTFNGYTSLEVSLADVRASGAGAAMRWQQRLRLGIAVFGAGFLVVLYMAFRAPRPSGGPPGAGRMTREDPEASAQSTSGELLNLVRDAENFRLEYDTLLTYPDGRQKLEGARVAVPNRGGRDFTVKAREAEVGAGQDRIRMQGAVQLESSDGLVAKTEAADYSQSEGILRAPGPASFTKGRMSGSSVGMTYDKDRDAIAMLDRASMAITPDTPESPPVQITSGSAYFARADHYVRYERDFTLVSGARTLSSALATAYLTGDGARVESLEMRGSSRITGVGEGAGALRAMDADDINLEFAGDGRTLAGATLASRRPGRASIELGANGGTRRVVGQWIDVRFAADGATVSGLTVRESVVLTLPAAPAAPPRTISAASLIAKAEGGSSLNAARFVEHVEYRESPAGAAPRIVRSRTLDAATAPGLGSMTDARFSGAVRFEEGPLRAASGQARYLVDRGRIDLDGVDETTGQSPGVTDGQVAIDAGHIEITTDPRRITAARDVRSVMAPAAKEASSPGGGITRAGMLKRDQPVYAASAALDYDSTARVAVYTAEAPAQARLWQGDTTIQADRLTVDDATGNLAGTGSVATTFMIEETDEKTGTRERTPTIGRADAFLYDDGPRTATYTGRAHVAGPQGDLEASRIELFLAAEASELERLEAYTAIALRDATRVVSGDRLTYTAADGRYLVVGSPVKIEADCRETTGRTLTFYRSTNNIVVEPNDEFRTQVKAIPNCVVPGRK